MASHQKPSFLGDESDEPTIAPSRSSMTSGQDKETEVARAPPSPSSSPSARDAAVDDEKTQKPPEGARISEGEEEKGNKDAGALGRAVTVTSQTGHALAEVPTRQDGTPYPTGLKLIIIILALCLAVFLVALDNSIIATAIPRITDQFHSLNDVGWYGSAYLLTTAALQLLFGKLYTYFSVKWVYLIAIFLFEVGSLICGVANNSLTLIMGRAIAGLGSAGLFSGSLIILAHSVPMAKRPLYTGLIGSMYGIASVAGPLLGGAFTDRVTWRWCFYINLPIGAITIFVIAMWFEEPSRMTAAAADETWRERIWKLDPIGTLIFMPAIICLLLALQWGGTTYPWSDGRIIALFVVFGVLIIAWLFVQWRQQDSATVPPRIISQRSVMASSIFAFCMGAAFLSAVYFVPLWFQSVKGASAVDSGIMNLPMLLAVVILSLIAGGLVTYLGYYAPFMGLGTVLTAVGFGLISTWHKDTDRPVWIGYQVIAGAGVGLGMQQPLMAVQTVLSIDDVPVGTSVVVFVQTLGGALFVSICQNIFTNRLVQNLAASFPGLDVSSVLKSGATVLVSQLDPSKIGDVLDAYSDALTKPFLVSAALAAATVLGSVLVEWKSVKGKNAGVAAV